MCFTKMLCMFVFVYDLLANFINHMCICLNYIVFLKLRKQIVLADKENPTILNELFYVYVF